MFSDLIDRIADAPREFLFLAVVVFLVTGQLAALYVLCDTQVHQAEVRHTAQRSERTAVANCLADNRGVSRRVCSERVAGGAYLGSADSGGDATQSASYGGDGSADAARYDLRSAPRHAISTMVPVNFAYR